MVFTLHRYIFRELFRVFILATLALTVMLSLGSILWPVQHYGVGPRQVLHLIVYFLPVTLTFVLPIAALFASSLVYGRLASDNELDACRASGISLTTLVYPGLVLAIVVAIANLVLSFHVMPVFVHQAEKSIKADARQILFRNIQRKGYYKLPPEGRYLIYADRADSKHNTLAGVVIVKTGPMGVEKIITAQKATIQFISHERFNEVLITAEKTYQMDRESSYSLGMSCFSAEFGSLLGDDIKFKKLKEMKRIRDVDMMLFGPVAKLARLLYAQLITELLAEDISTVTAKAGGLYQLYSGQKLIKFRAGNCVVKDEKNIELSGQVMVQEYDSLAGRLLRTLRCRKALLSLEGDELTPTLTLQLYNPSWKRQDRGEQSAWGWVRIRGLIVPAQIDEKVNKFRTETGLKVRRLASEAELVTQSDSTRLKELRQRLQRKIRSTLAEIEAETHSRLVFGLGCISMIMIGIGLGIMLKGGHLLSAFGVSCVPAAVLVIAILMGKNIAKNPGSQVVSGSVLMWAGFVLLSVLAAGIYHRLLKT